MCIRQCQTSLISSYLCLVSITPCFHLSFLVEPSIISQKPQVPEYSNIEASMRLMLVRGKTEPLDSLAAEEFPLHTFYWFECFIQLRPDQTSCPVSKGQTRPFAQYNSISSGQNRTSIGRLTWFHPFQTFGPPTSVDNIFWEWCKKMGWQRPTEAKLSTAQTPGTNWTVSPFWDKKKTLLYLLSGH